MRSRGLGLGIAIRMITYKDNFTLVITSITVAAAIPVLERGCYY